MINGLLAIMLVIPSAMAPRDGVNLKYKRFLIKQVRFVWGMDQKVSIFAAQIRQESNWNSKAESKYAAGLSQFTPQTARWISKRYSTLKVAQGARPDIRYDWKWSIKAMVFYDEFLYQKIEKKGQPKNQRWPLTLRAYNGGLGWIYKELNSCRDLNLNCCLKFRKDIFCRENIEYPKKILNRWEPLYRSWNR